jgi:glycosyltransferase involved in cell wall biosynthesis
MSRDNERLLSVVVIGLNEESRLKESLEAVFACRPHGFELQVIYVDSGSIDRSVEIAQAVPGVEVLHLEGDERSAARARNVGLRRARGNFVQLIDGDSVVQPGWMDAALQVLERSTDIVCVFGRCTEMHPEQSIYMRVCGFDWHIPPGDHRFCGGNAMWKRSVLLKHGLFDESLRAGEEPDLCYRVRQNRGRIVCLDAPMVTHDLGMRRFEQYWKRGVGSGRAYAAIASRYWRTPERLWLRETVVNFVEPGVWILLAVVGWHLWGPLGAAVLLLTWYVIRTLRIAYTVRKRSLRLADALLYAVHCQFVRLPLAIGQLKTFMGVK